MRLEWNKPPLREVCRRLGCIEQTLDADSQSRLAVLWTQLTAAGTPRGVWRCFGLDDAGRRTVAAAGEDLAAHLAGCHSVALMALTLGSEADTLARRLSVRELGDAVLLDALCSAAVETLADALEERLRCSLPEGSHCTPRYSPGYGDFDLAAQQPLLAALDAQRGIGLFVTETKLLTPRKSITAVLGIADHPVKGRRAGCASCRLREHCNYQKQGAGCCE